MTVGEMLVYLVLCERVFLNEEKLEEGFTVEEVAALAGESREKALNLLSSLAEKGYVVAREDGKWALTREWPAILERIAEEAEMNL